MQALIRREGNDSIRRLVAQAQGEWLAAFDATQRAVIGFPRVGSGYWNEQTLQETKARYSGSQATNMMIAYNSKM